MKISEATEQVLRKLYKQQFGVSPDAISALPASGSDRRYYRLSSMDASAIGVYGPNLAENRRFIYLANVLRSKCGDVVPQVYCADSGGLFYLQQDLGTESLFDYISKCRAVDEPGKVEEVVCRCMAELPALQCAEMDYSRLYEPFGWRMVIRDLNYFRYCMLKPSGIDPDEDLIDVDFYNMAVSLQNIPEEYVGFMYRDCQSRNVMLKDDKIYWIDFQGGRRGPVLYDVASFLWQARANFDKQTRQAGVEAYINAFCNLRPLAKAETMRDLLPKFVLLRQLQVLGAYGFRGLIEHRAHFILSIGPAIANLVELLADGACDEYPELKHSLEALVDTWRHRLGVEVEHGSDKKLTVNVFSFSYKKGYPADYTGNGGGFMFDCRGMHNPGRYEQYKQLTGRDKPVIDFLEERGEVQDFVKNAAALVEPSVATYLRRGFESLQVGFGCTGGQHRSVYCAEALARKIKADYPEANVVLTHREQEIKEVVS